MFKEIINLELKVEEDGIRIDKYIADNTELTRTAVQSMLENGLITVND